MSAHVNLGLVFHQHQPVGNYGFVFEELLNLSYEPLLACLERHPAIKAGLHYSGPLLQWLEESRPGYLARVRALVERGQVEMLGGGFYEPILPAIPHRDRVGQLQKMKHEVARLFGVEPGGMWLAERVWEPDLPRAISEGGYDWTIVDDVHFVASGFRAEDLSGWYLTESDGRRTGLFASSTAFRYLVPWGTVESCIDFLRSHGDRAPGGLLVMGDDGEKFGGWPTTYKHCWEGGWVDAFFDRLEREAEWISTVHLGDWQRTNPPVQLAYLPSTSYMEMGEWSLPPDAQTAMEEAKTIFRQQEREDLAQFLRGGHWRNFLVRYPEVNLLQKRLLLLSEEAAAADNAAATDSLWRAQCNCPYWHGVFGGVYLEHIRHANFANMAAADAALHPGSQPPDVRDWDFDGRDEACLRSDDQLVIVDDDGSVQEWELREIPWHLTHVVARRPEAYHRSLAASAGGGTHSIHDGVRLKDPAALNQLTDYDRGLRLAAQDTIILNPGYEYRLQRLAAPVAAQTLALTGGAIELRCESRGETWTKEVALVPGGLRTTYTGAEGATLYSEWNLSLPERAEGALPLFDWHEGRVRIETGLFVIEGRFEGFRGTHEQIFSASNTEGGVELQPQGWAIVFRGDPGATGQRRSIEWTIGR